MRFFGSTLIAASLFSLACADTPTKPSVTARDGDAASSTRRTPLEARVYMVAAGNAHTCILTGLQRLRCWGANGEGQAPAEQDNPVGNYYAVTGGTGNSTCALRDEYSVECFGNNDFGQAPGVIVAQTSSFMRVDAGYSHACAVRFDGVIECWGGDPETYAPAQQVAHRGVFTDVSAGHETTCALRSDGAAECRNVSGLSGFHNIVFSVKPAHFISISAGAGFVCGVKGVGTVACRGNNEFGQAPLNKVAAASKFVEVSVGNTHSCALRMDRVVECWGSNSFGQAPATRSASVSYFEHISAGANHTCGLRHDAQAECWGLNSSGQTTVPPNKFFTFRGLTSPQLTAPAGQVSHVVQYSGGRKVSLKFSLGSNEGLEVLAPGYPQMAPINCATPGILTTGSATAGSLSYNASANEYAYTWSVPGELINTCQQFILKLTDGTYHRANFRFTTHPVTVVQIGGLVESSPALVMMAPITLQVRDQYGVGVADKDVLFQVMQGGGSVAYPIRTTDARGFVVVPPWMLGLPGTQVLRVTVVAASGNLTNDMSVTAQPGTPDRAVENFALSAGPYHPGDHVTLSYSLKNNGTAGAVASTGTVRLSTDATITAADDDLGPVPVPHVAPGQAAPTAITVKLPDALPLGSYYLGVLVNDHALLPESDLGNNTAQGLTVVDPTFLSLPNRIGATGLPTFCALTAAGSPYCWGKNNRRQFGTVSTSAGSSSPVSAPLPALVEFTRGTSEHSCGFDVSGAASCWGHHYAGALGDGVFGTFGASTVPVAVSGGIIWKQIAVGLVTTCGVSTVGTGYCWGANQFGEVGGASVPQGGIANTATLTTTPRAIDGGHTFTSVVNGLSHACGIDVAGDAWCWGYNGFGQLGNGSIYGLPTHPTPTLVVGGHKFVQLTATAVSTCGITVDHDAYCWGKNTFGQLGNGTTTNTGTPTLVSGGNRFSLIIASSGFSDSLPGIPAGSNGSHGYTCALTEPGVPYCWGLNHQGQLGDGTTTMQLTPVAVAGSPHFTNLALNSSTTCGVKGNQIWCWGSNHKGQMGNGTTTPSLTPTLVLSPFNSP